MCVPVPLKRNGLRHHKNCPRARAVLTFCANLPGRHRLVDFGPRRRTPAERHRVPRLRDLSERSGPPGPGRSGTTAALGRHDPGYTAHAARARRTTGRARGHGRGRRVVAVGSRFFGQRESLRAQVQVGHATGDDLMEGREEAHFVRLSGISLHAGNK